MTKCLVGERELRFGGFITHKILGFIRTFCVNDLLHSALFIHNEPLIFIRIFLTIGNSRRILKTVFLYFYVRDAVFFQAFHLLVKRLIKSPTTYFKKK